MNVIETAALYYRAGGSDKVWGAGVVREDDGRTTFVACWGARGRVGQPQTQTFPGDGGFTKYRSKVAAKRKEGYRDLATARTDLPTTLSGPQADAALADIQTVLASGHPALTVDSAPPPTVAPRSGLTDQPRIVCSHVLPLPAHTLALALTDPRFGLSEKANGTRCLIEYDGTQVRAYNRQGRAQPTVPTAAQALPALGLPCLVDGERLERDQAGQYVLFDLLEWNGASVRDQSYQQRIALLEAALTAAGLIRAGGPTLAHAQATTATPGLLLLTPACTLVDKTSALAAIEASGGEGVIIRTLAAPSLPGDTPHERKVKFQAEIDCLVLAHEQRRGHVDGTFTIGLRRPDGAWIAVGHAGTGLSKAEFAQVRAAVQAGLLPVLSVRFLTARTVGIALVEPVVTRWRADKPAAACGTDQLVEALGAERTALIAAAPAWTQAQPAAA